MLPKLLAASQFVLLDIESTGLSRKEDQPLQVAFAHVDFGQTRLRGYYTMKPSVPIKEGAMAKHGITEEKVAHSPSFGQVSEDLFKHLSGRVVLGWNVRGFDVPILDRMFKETAVALDDSRYSVWAEQTLVLDALLWDRHLVKEGKHDLATAADRWGISTEGYHDAWADCRIAWQIFGRMCLEHPKMAELTPEQAIAVQDNKFDWSYAA